MNIEDKRTDERPVARRRFPYSLRTLLLLIATLVAIVCSLIIVSPDSVRVASVLCLLAAIPAVLTTEVVYGRGYMRTFCIGALFPAAWSAFSLGGIFSDACGYILSIDINGLRWVGGPLTATLVVSIVLNLVVGLIAVGTRWWIERPQRRNPRDMSSRE